MMDRNEISQTLRSDNLMWGQPITAIQLDSSKIDAWFDEFIDTETLCTEEFEFSNCKTSNGVDKNYTIDYRVPMDIVYDEFSLFINDLGPKMQMSSAFEVPWINVYEKNGFQDAHDHQGTRNSDFSWCYIHKAGDSHIVFKNRNATNSDNCLKEYFDVYEAHMDFVPELTGKGTLYIFPSAVLHAVSPNKGDNPRITISGNVRVVPAESGRPAESPLTAE